MGSGQGEGQEKEGGAAAQAENCHEPPSCLRSQILQRPSEAFRGLNTSTHESQEAAKGRGRAADAGEDGPEPGGPCVGVASSLAFQILKGMKSHRPLKFRFLSSCCEVQSNARDASAKAVPFLCFHKVRKVCFRGTTRAQWATLQPDALLC